jgi:hypothetical protein
MIDIAAPRFTSGRSTASLANRFCPAVMDRIPAGRSLYMPPPRVSRAAGRIVMNDLKSDDKPDWERIECDVIMRLRLLQAAWEMSARESDPGTAELHAAMRRDFYIPALECLGDFCRRIEIEEDEEREDESGGGK